MEDLVAGARPLVDRYWEDLLRLDPLLATSIGDDRFDDHLPDPSSAGLEAAARVHQGLLTDLAAIDRSSVDPDLQATLDIAESTARDELAAVSLRLDRIHHVDHLLGPISLVGYLAAIVRADDDERVARYCARLRAFGPYLDTVIDEMASGREAGVVPPRPVVERVIAQTRRLLATPPDATPFLTPVEANDEKGRAAVLSVLRDDALPAFARYLEAVERDRATARDTMGLVALPHGARMYAACIRRWTSRDFAPEELHQRGREAMSWIQGDRAAILERLGFGRLDDALAAYDRAARRRLTDRRAVLGLVRSYVERGWEGARPYFRRMPPANCDVRLVEEFREPDQPGAFYQPPSEGREGIYFVNAAFYLDTNSRLLHRLATTSYHEANPGHHFQTSTEQDQRDAPPLRRFAGSFRGDAFSEGWGLYSERLADEIGLYEDDYERLGMLDNEALRAVRLVVDTGLHAFGWDREAGIAELVRAGLPRLEAEIEVDRYAVDPAQALCYKVGELEIRRLRGRFAPDGGREPLASFHDRLLSLGALPLATIERELERLYGATATGVVQ